MITGALEDNVITMLVWSEEHAATVASRVTPDMFSTPAYRKVAEVAFDFLERYKQPPRHHMRDLLEDDIRRGDRGKLILVLLEAMEGLEQTLNHFYVLDSIDRFIGLRHLRVHMEGALDKIAEGDLLEARAIVSEAVRSIDTVQPGIWLANAEQSLGFFEQREDDFFPSGVQVLDDCFIRPARGTLFLFIAPAKRGKSWHLIQMGRDACLHGRSVLHITLENSDVMTAQRYIQSFFSLTRHAVPGGITIQNFIRDVDGAFQKFGKSRYTRNSLEEEGRAAIVRRLEGMKHRLRLKIQEFPTGSLTIGQLNQYLDGIAQVEKFHPDLIIIDYPDLMKIASRDLRIDTGLLFRDLRRIAKERNAAMAVVTQGNRSSDTARYVRGNMVAEDWSKIGTSDIVLCYSQTSAERDHNLARIWVDAARNQEDKFEVLITQSYKTGQFCIDSIRISMDVREQLAKSLDEAKNADKSRSD